MQQWSQGEGAAFKGDWRDPHGAADSSGCGPMPMEVRIGAVRLLRTLAGLHDAQAEMPAALALLDALRAAPRTAQQPFGSLERGLATPVVVAAAARLVWKHRTGTSAKAESFSDEVVAQQLELLGEAVGEPGSITRAEVDILAALSGRIGLPSPADWVSAVLGRLGALAAPKAAREQLEGALPSAVSWAGVLAERVAATPRLPPRALALGALALGLVGAGILKSDEFRPPSLPDPVWNESLLAKAAQNGARGEAARLSAGQLAWAACCDESELRRCAFAGVLALQRSLSGAS